MIRTNLSTRPFYNERLVRLFLLGLLVLVLAATAFNVTRVLRYYGAPLAWELQGSNIQQYVGRDGSVTYTNVAPRRTAALQTK